MEETEVDWARSRIQCRGATQTAEKENEEETGGGYTSRKSVRGNSPRIRDRSSWEKSGEHSPATQDGQVKPRDANKRQRWQHRSQEPQEGGRIRPWSTRRPRFEREDPV